VILPDNGIDLQELILDQNFTSFSNLFSDYETIPEEMQDNSSFSLPSFEVSYGKIFKELLTNLGMPDAFSRSSADFSQIVDEPHKPWIGYIKQEAWIRTNEQGTEATAATIVMMEEGMPFEFHIFNANRPFLYIIRDDRNGSLLFIGIMNNH